jgi:hypothetical protein
MSHFPTKPGAEEDSAPDNCMQTPRVHLLLLRQFKVNIAAWPLPATGRQQHVATRCSVVVVRQWSVSILKQDEW